MDSVPPVVTELDAVDIDEDLADSKPTLEVTLQSGSSVIGLAPIADEYPRHRPSRHFSCSQYARGHKRGARSAARPNRPARHQLSALVPAPLRSLNLDRYQASSKTTNIGTSALAISPAPAPCGRPDPTWRTMFFDHSAPGVVGEGRIRGAAGMAHQLRPHPRGCSADPRGGVGSGS